VTTDHVHLDLSVTWSTCHPASGPRGYLLLTSSTTDDRPDQKVFFKLSEKKPVVLSKQPIVLLLGVFEKVENCFGWLTCCQTKTIVSYFQSIVCLKILTESVLLVKCVLNDFQTEYAPILNALINL